MSYEIGKNGIASIDFIVSLDRNSTIVKMTQPCEMHKFFEERDRIGHIFGASTFFSNSVAVNHGRYSEKTIIKFKRAVDPLRSIIDSQHYNAIIQKLEEMVAQVKIENDRKTAQFAPLLADFKTNVKNPYRNFNRVLMVDDSIKQLHYLIYDVCHYRGNPMKVGSSWVYLFLCEGALEHLIESLNTQDHDETKKCLIALHSGVTCFLKQYGPEIHTVIEKTITSNAQWFQQLYANYKSMVETGKPPPSEDCYVPGTPELFLPIRFAK